MDKQFKVAYAGIVAGDPNATEYEDMMGKIGLCSFTATTDQIVDVVNNMAGSNGLDLKQTGITLEKQAMEVYGGRGFGFFSTFEVAKEIISETDVLIVSTHSQAVFGVIAIQEIIRQNLPKSCIMVFRLPFSEEEASFHNSNLATRFYGQLGLQPSSSGKKKKNKKNQLNVDRVYSIGMEKYGGVDPSTSIPQLKSVLLSDELKEEIMKPIKETASAGKSIVNLGRSLANWVSKLVSSN